MKTRSIFTLTLTFVLGLVLSLPIYAKENSLSKEVKEIVNNEISHNNLVNIVKQTNVIEQKCDNISKDVEAMDVKNLKKDLQYITIEEFYSERACIEIVGDLMNKSSESQNMQDITKVFIDKFRHPDALMVSYAHGFGSMYTMTLLARWADSEYLCEGESACSQKILTNYADFLIREGADIYNVSEFSTWDKTSVATYVYANGTDMAKDLIKRTEKQNVKAPKLDDNDQKKIADIITHTNRIDAKCEDILLKIQANNAKGVAAELEEISVEEFYSERHCLDNISALLDQAAEGQDMIPVTKKFIKKFGHPDNLIVSVKDPNGNYYAQTLLAYWATSDPLKVAKTHDLGDLLIKKGASTTQVIEMPNNVTKTITIKGGKK